MRLRMVGCLKKNKRIQGLAYTRPCRRRELGLIRSADPADKMEVHLWAVDRADCGARTHTGLQVTFALHKWQLRRSPRQVSQQASLTWGCATLLKHDMVTCRRLHFALQRREGQHALLGLCRLCGLGCCQQQGQLLCDAGWEGEAHCVHEGLRFAVKSLALAAAADI